MMDGRRAPGGNCPAVIWPRRIAASCNTALISPSGSILACFRPPGCSTAYPRVHRCNRATSVRDQVTSRDNDKLSPQATEVFSAAGWVI